MPHRRTNSTKTNPQHPRQVERHTPERLPPESFQSGASQAQKAEGQTPGRQSEPGKKRPDEKRGETPGETKDFGESHDRPLGERNRGAGGKIDSTQRDMGQTGQNMRGRRDAKIHAQQGPYGPREKHRGPVAAGKPLMDDWGKSDKH